MGFFDLLKRKPKADELPPLKLQKASIGSRIAQMSMKQYKVQMSMNYDGKPMRKFDVIIRARSRNNAAFIANKNVSFTVISAKQNK